MGYIIAAIVVLFATFVISGAMIRKKIYSEVDHLGAWKIEIMNKSIAEEIAKVKALNMVGETEKKFEQWRSEWEQIVTKRLPDLEEMLFEAEEASDKYRFRKAKAVLTNIQQELDRIEQQLDEMLTEVNEWVGSEEKNRDDIVFLKESYRQGKQYLLTHYPSFGKAARRLEDSFEKVAECFVQYEQLTEQGNYPEARQILLEIKQLLIDTKEKMEIIPELRVQLRSEIPSRLKELGEKIVEMESQGFILDRRSLEKEITAIYHQVDHEINNLEKNNVKGTTNTVKDIYENIDRMYDLLEKEILAKQAVLKERETVKQQLELIKTVVEELKNETEVVALSYRIDDKDLKSQKELEKRMEKLSTRFLVVEEAVAKQEQSYSSVLEMVEEIKEKLAHLEQLNEDYKQMLKNLRKDELEAQATIKTLKKQLFSAKRLIQKYNLPGLPDHYVTIIGNSEEKITDVEKRLAEKPLDIPTVNDSLKKALQAVSECLQTTEEMVERVLLTEKLIQYGNRYRSQHRFIEDALNKAEDAFRRYDYEASLETAARAIQRVDPEALKKLRVEIEHIEPVLSTN